MNFVEKLRAEAIKDIYAKVDLMKQEYLIASENNLIVYYAPFDYINKDASVVIVGITPGWTQMEKSFRTAIEELNKGTTLDEAFRKVKSESSFAGSMRFNLINMLDELGLQYKLSLNSTAELFDIDNDLLHSTSALRYPVFNNGKNYTGSLPSPLKSQLLWSQIEANLIPEMNHFTNSLVIPLGKNVDDVFTMLKVTGKLNNNSVLTGFPHPSGANGHRAKQFEMNKAQMKEAIANWNP
ncbi:hypothetical protein SAMN05421545_2843 [Pontibacter lucknowensis]|uniref:Uracil DNA glycosylase superfamily protein n=2 Tax=Pontibacter lucknowensis TaxID=1077936 RepID=A0A1N6Z9P9_9BACT|nr:hypothetical protein SAMN05421545_2843 [Pontibacter lucknowensis]